MTTVRIHIMARTNQLSKEKQQYIITLRTEGQSVWKIAKTLNLSPSAVARTIKHYDETGSHEDRSRKGRPRVTSAAEEEFLCGVMPPHSDLVCFSANYLKASGYGPVVENRSVPV